MKKLKSLCFSILVSGFSYSQVSFYINPKLGGALTITKVNDDSKPIFNGNSLSPYTLYKNHGFLKTPNMSFGIGAGILLKDRHKIELEWEKSAVSYNIETFAYDFRFAEKSGTAYESIVSQKLNRIFVNYAYRLTKNPNKTSVWFNAATGVSFSSTFNLLVGPSFEPHNFQLTPVVHLDYINFRSTTQQNINTVLKIGFDSDLYHKEKYLFSLSLAYIQGFGKLHKNEYALGYIKYTEDFSHKTPEEFSREVFSRGSALQFSISRRFQLYPWIPLSKKKRESKDL